VLNEDPGQSRGVPRRSRRHNSWHSLDDASTGNRPSLARGLALMTHQATYMVFLNDGDDYRVECDWAEMTEHAVVCFNQVGNDGVIAAVFPLLSISAFVEESLVCEASKGLSADIEIPPGTMSN